MHGLVCLSRRINEPKWPPTSDIHIHARTHTHTHTQVAYHDFEGVTVRLGERERLVANLGGWVRLLPLYTHINMHAHSWSSHRSCPLCCCPSFIPSYPNGPASRAYRVNLTTPHPQTPKITGDKNVMILRNHGLLVAGPDVARAFFTYYSAQRACEVRVVSCKA